MQLGEAILKELDLEQTDDILSRWLAHHIAELMQAADTAQRQGTPDEAALTAKQCREAILQLWAHRTDWPEGWPPPQAAKMAKRLKRLDDPAQPWQGRSIFNDLETAHNRLLSALIDCAVRTGDAPDLPWLTRFRDVLSEDEITILERAATIETRLGQLAAGPAQGESAEVGTENPLLDLANAYRDVIANRFTRPSEA